MTIKKRKLNKFKKAKSLFLCAFCCAFLSCFQAPAYSVEPQPKAFNLITVVDTFLNLDGDSKSEYESADEKTRQKQEYIDTTRRFNQGNVSLAYNDYSKIVSELDNDVALFVFAKSMYEIGFFTLGDVAISKIKNQMYFASQTENLKKSYKDSYDLEKGEEIYLAKAYASIYFDNTPEETAFDLSKKTSLMEKSDYANFVMAQALLESRQYQQALMFIDTAIKKNPENSNYLSYKAEVLNRAGKHKEALKFIEKYENSEILTPEFKNKFLIQKEEIVANLSGNENDKKFHLITANYLRGNYYKVINECQNILNFNKNNYKILTLQAQSQLNTGKVDLAKKNLLQSFDLNKNYGPTLSGLGDIYFIEGEKQKAIEYYKKAIKTDKTNSINLLKLQIAYKNVPGNEKNLAKLEKQINALPNSKNLFYEYYIVSTGVLKNDIKQKREYLMKSLAINLLYESSWGEYLAYLNQSKKQKPMENFLYMISFVNNFNYKYYYFTGVMEMALGNRESARANMKHCISLNPDFEPANDELLKIEESTI